MKKLRNKRLLAFLCLLLAAAVAATGCYWQKKEQVSERALLCRIFPDMACGLYELQAALYPDPASTAYEIILDDQFERPETITVSYQAAEPLRIYRINSSGKFIGYWEIKKGTHSFAVSKDDASLYLSVPKEADSAVSLTCPGSVAEGTYQGKYLSVLGDSISSYAGYVSPGCYPAYTEELNVTVQDMWWYELARLTGMNICSVNASGGSGVTEIPDPLHTGNGERCTQLSSFGRDPDVICVLLGLNDFFKQVDPDAFKAEYTQMANRIHQTYPEAELLLCTYFELPGDYKPFVYNLNRIISEVAEEQGFRVLDLCASMLSYEEPENRYVDFDPASGAGVHPNDVGQLILGRTAASLLTGQN